MNLYICEICGDAYVGAEKPKNCPFCGAGEAFIKNGQEANPIFNREEEIGETSKKNLLATYDLEVKAVAIYNCMAGKAENYWQKAMYKRLAKVELEHAVIVTKLLGTEAPKVGEEVCSDNMKENFQKTIDLEDNATNLYRQFNQESQEEKVKVFFTAVSQVEADHLDLIKKFL